MSAVGTEIDAAVLNASNGWKHTFSDLHKYQDGEEIVYTIKEDSVTGYTTKITGDAEQGFVVTNTQNTTPPPANPGTTTSPKTGDTANLGVSLLLLILSMLGIGGIIMYNRRLEKK